MKQQDDHVYFFFSSRRRHTRLTCDWSSDVCSSDLATVGRAAAVHSRPGRARSSEHACGGELTDALRLVAAELDEDLLGVLAAEGPPAGRPLRAGEPKRRRDLAHRSQVGVLELDDVLTGASLRVVECGR